MENSMLTIKDKNIFSDNGDLLKVIDCPKNLSGSDLTQTSDYEFHCDRCEKQVVATDYLNEPAIIQLLADAPDTCLKISRFDPLFRFES